MRFIESIRLENGKLLHLDLHQARLNLTTLAHFGYSIRIDLLKLLQSRSLPAVGSFKIRVLYGGEVDSVDIEPYTRRSVQRAEIVAAKEIDYRFKYADRAALEALSAQVPAGTQPLLVQQGLLTDGLYANLCFFDGARWLTPERPLLAGVARAVGLKNGQIFTAIISAADVRAGRYSKVKLINCMNLFQEAQEILL